MTWDMENLVSHFPPKHLGDKDVGNFEEAGYVADTWGAATFSSPAAALTKLKFL